MPHFFGSGCHFLMFLNTLKMFFHVKEILPIISRFQSELWVAIKKYNSLDLWICFLIHEPFFEVQPTDVGQGCPWSTRHRWTYRPFAVICRLCMNLGMNFSCFFFSRKLETGEFPRFFFWWALGSLKRERGVAMDVWKVTIQKHLYKYFNGLQNIYCAGERSAVCCSHNIHVNVIIL